ncbi:hypothetical protein MJG53_004111 [Ovis ammon polii x Ovis aries]|uniref:Uncharacterized protein n=1 Tax=Ovis ammon polii x Ovis aries TaxID=2918886 RepID=A0ACB9V8R0_9CETA|nr:hypothetical protein MJG53_004111 [Ovis ammon polii x Ovis aries]
MDEEPIIYSITALNQDFQQRHTPKNVKDKLNPNELPLTKKKLKHQKPCKKQHKNIAEDVNDEASSKKPSLKIQQKALIKQSVQLGPSTDLSEESGCCSCQEKWIGYQCNCYFISNELKTWKDSRDFCIFHNSSLLQHLLNKVFSLNPPQIFRKDFMKFNTNFYWIGLSYDEEHHAWLWEDNSTLSQDLFPFLKSVNPKNCMMYIPIGTILDGHCETKSRYICKQQLT